MVKVIGKNKFHSKEKDKDFFVLYITYPMQDKNLGYCAESKFVSEDIYNLVPAEKYGCECELQYQYQGGRYPQLCGIKFNK